MKKLLLLLFTAILSLNIQAQSIDAQKSTVNFKISNMKINTVKGTFTGMNGKIKFNEKDLDNASFDVCLDAATINTNNKNRDKTLKEAGFFDVEKYPKICYKSTYVYVTPDGFETKGQLTMHGITKEVIIDFTHSAKHYNGNLVVNREDFKIGDSMGSFFIGNTAKMEIDCFIK